MSKVYWTYLSAPELTVLDIASLVPMSILEDTPYLVGSVLERADWRDVDVRIILPDDRFDRLFIRKENDPLLAFINLHFSLEMQKATQLPVDFQIQRMTEANERYKGRRHPLAIYPYPAGVKHDA